MKKILFLLVGIWAGLVSTASAMEDVFASGEEWLHHMSKREKFIALIPPSFLFERYDVRLLHSLPEYVYLIDKVMEYNPQLETEDVSSIFASTVYLFEPHNRQALKTLELDFLKGDFEVPALRQPELTFQELIGAN